MKIFIVRCSAIIAFVLNLIPVSVCPIQSEPLEKLPVYKFKMDPQTQNFKFESPNPNLPDVSMLINPSGINYDSSFTLSKRNAIETFSIPSLSQMNPSVLPGKQLNLGFHFGTGVQSIGNQFHVYSDEYRVNLMSDRDRNLFTVGVGQNNIWTGSHSPFGGGLYIGVGHSYNSNSGKHITSIGESVKMGSILPTGTAFLSEYKMNINQNLQLQSQTLFLNQGWNPVTSVAHDNSSAGLDKIIRDKDHQKRSYLAETNHYLSNSLKDYFPVQAAKYVNREYAGNGNSLFSEKKQQLNVVTPKSTAHFYQQSDPTQQGGPSKYIYVLPDEKTFEYAESKGFHYRRFPVKIEEKVLDLFRTESRTVQRWKENVVAKQYNPGEDKSWSLHTSVNQIQSVEKINSLQRFSSDNGGTAERFKMTRNLSLEPTLNDDWTNFSRLERRDVSVFANYRTAREGAVSGLMKMRPGFDDVKYQLQVAVRSNPREGLPDFDTNQVEKSAVSARPHLLKSRDLMGKISFGMEIARKTEFISHSKYEKFKMEQDSVNLIDSASKTILPRLKLQNEILSQSAHQSSNYEVLTNNMSTQKKISGDIVSDLKAIEHAGSLFSVKGLQGGVALYSRSAKEFSSIYLQPSNVEYAKAKMSAMGGVMSMSPYLLTSAIKFSFNALALEGKEDKNLWKRVSGDIGGLITERYVPGSNLGERMILAYSHENPPNTGSLFFAGTLQTIDDTLKLASIGGIQKPSPGWRFFSDESISASLNSLKNNISRLPVSAAFASAHSVIDQLCEGCEGLKTAVQVTQLATDFTRKIATSYKIQTSQRENLMGKISSMEKLSVLNNQILKYGEKESRGYLLRRSLNEGIHALNHLTIMENSNFAREQLNPTLKKLVPVTANWMDEKVEYLTSK